MRYKWTPKVYPPIDAVWVVFDGLTSYIHITSHRSRMSVLQRLQSLAKRRGGLARAHEQSLVNGGFLPLRGIELPSRAYPWDCARRYR